MDVTGLCAGGALSVRRWLATIGVQDFASGIVVRTTADIASLVLVLKLGPRRHFNKRFYPPPDLLLSALVWAFLEWRIVGKPNLVAIVTGLIAGLATVTPAAGYVGLPGALVLGVVGNLLCYYVVPLLRQHLKIDDSLDVFAVHGQLPNKSKN